MGGSHAYQYVVPMLEGSTPELETWNARKSSAYKMKCGTCRANDILLYIALKLFWNQGAPMQSYVGRVGAAYWILKRTTDNSN